MRAFVALVRNKQTGFDEPIACSTSEDVVKRELRTFCEFNKDNTNDWDLDNASVEPVKFFDERLHGKSNGV